MSFEIPGNNRKIWQKGWIIPNYLVFVLLCLRIRRMKIGTASCCLQNDSYFKKCIIWDLATHFREVGVLFTDFKTRTNYNISDSKTMAQLLDKVDARFECCHELYENVMRNG